MVYATSMGSRRGVSQPQSEISSKHTMRIKLDTKPLPLRVGVPAMAVILGSFLSGMGNIPYTLSRPRLTIRRRCYDGPFSICHPCIFRYQRQHRAVTPAMDATLSLRPHVYTRIMCCDIWALRICLPAQKGLGPQAIVPIWRGSHINDFHGAIHLACPGKNK